MATRFDDYVTDQIAGLKEGVGDVTRGAVADIGDSYQEILLGDSNISAPDGWTQAMESVSYEMERPPPGAPTLETDPSPAKETFMEPGIDHSPEIDMET